MTHKEQRIAIAESRGWDCDPQEARGWGSRGQWVVSPHGNKSLLSKQAMPDYLYDLNPWQGIERELPQADREAYQHSLVAMCQCPYEAIHATAAQRAEAYLRTIGKWCER